MVRQHVNYTSKFPEPQKTMMARGISFYGHLKRDEGGDTDLMQKFCWPNK